MKKNDLLIVLAAIAYTLLFYNQLPGLNVLAFTATLTALSLIQDPSRIKRPSWIASALGAIVSAFMVFQYGTSLPVVANIISLAMLAGFSLHSKNSLLVAIFHSVISLLTTIPNLIINQLRNKSASDSSPQESGKPSKSSIWKGLLLFTGPLAITLLFFFIYKDANPVFEQFTEKLNLDFISLKWIRFTLIGYLVCYAFFMPRLFRPIHEIDTLKGDSLSPDSEGVGFIRRLLSMSSEWKMALVLLVMLNALIAVVNGLDIHYMWILGDVPDGVNYSDYTRNGIGSLIMALVLAIIVVLFFFRGRLNFHEQKNLIIGLAILWLLQNGIMIASSVLKNFTYVESYGLTHKRIGVFIYLLLALVGLATTLIKVIARRNNWFLFRKNAWVFYGIMIICTALNWDEVITKFNITNENRVSTVEVDRDYLLRLSHNNLHHLHEYREPFEYKYLNEHPAYEESQAYSSRLDNKIYDFVTLEGTLGFRSYVMSRKAVYDHLNKSHEDGNLSSLFLSWNYDFQLDGITQFPKLQHLDLSNCGLGNELSPLSKLEGLTQLNLSSNGIYDASAISGLSQLTFLDISDNTVSSPLFLEGCKNLEYLDYSWNYLEQVNDFPELPNLTQFNVSGNKMKDFSFLTSMPNLEILTMENVNYTVMDTLPNIPSLLEIDASENNAYHNQSLKIIGTLANNTQIEKLDLSRCDIKNTSLLSREVIVDLQEERIPLFPNVTHLSIAGNELYSLHSLGAYQFLKELDISGNNLSDVNSLDVFMHLQEIDVSYNRIQVLDSLVKCKSLKTIHLSGNQIPELDGSDFPKSIKSIDLSNNNLRVLENLDQLNSLEELNLSGNEIENAESLIQLKQLKKLDISYNWLTEYEWLKEMTHLEELTITGFSVDEYWELEEALPETKIIAFDRHIGEGSSSSLKY